MGWISLYWRVQKNKFFALFILLSRFYLLTNIYCKECMATNKTFKDNSCLVCHFPQSVNTPFKRDICLIHLNLYTTSSSFYPKGLDMIAIALSTPNLKQANSVEIACLFSTYSSKMLHISNSFAVLFHLKNRIIICTS